MSQEMELGDLIREAGTKLLQIPSPVDELLALLDQVDNYLSKVEQSPSKSMLDALSPSMNALVASDLLRHVDRDVRVSVASCISEITRITAPDAPYTDEQMKQIFQLIVGAFEMFWDTSSRSYAKRISILETVAKVRSCVVMLDLECDGLILEMFQLFLKNIREDHPDKVFSCMETIMSLVLEESEEILPELLYPLLTSVKKENQSVLPVARKLGEKVLESCTSKLKPYLSHAVKSIGMSSNDYSKIVASICQDASYTTEHNDENVSGKHLADERSSPEKTGSDKPPEVIEELRAEAACSGDIDMVSEKSAKLVTSNGDAQNNGDELSEPVSQDAQVDPQNKEELSEPVSQDAQVDPQNKEELSKPASQDAQVDPQNKEELSKPASQDTQVDPQNKKELSKPASQDDQVEPHDIEPLVAKEETKPDETAKNEQGQKPNTPEASGNSNIDIDKETTGLASQKKSHSQDDDNSLAEDQSIEKPMLPSEPEKDAVAENPSPTPEETVKVASPSPSQSLVDVGRSKRGRPGAKKGTVKEVTEHRSPSPPKEALSCEQVDSDATLSADTISKKGSEGENEKEEPNILSDKKGESDEENEERTSGASTDSDEKPLRLTGKKVYRRSRNNKKSSAKKQGDKSKEGTSKNVPAGELPGELSHKKTDSTLKSTEKSKSKNQKSLEETPKSTSKRKRTPAKEETSDKPSGKDLGQKLVGSKIKVWWPDDKKFYEGEVESFNPKQKKHKVVYRDGDEELLFLEKERWELIEDYSVLDEDQSTDSSSPDTQMPQKKKTKPNSASKQPKTDASMKKGKEPSASKSKDEAEKSGGKSKNDGKHDNKAVEDSPKTASDSKNDRVGKSKGNTPKTGSKSREDTLKHSAKLKVDPPNTSTKSKGAASKTPTKSKDATPKTGTKTKKETPESETESEDETAKTKTPTKSKDATPKTGTKSKKETPESETEPEDETAKTKTKSKNLAPKSGSKSGANDTYAKGKPGSSKGQESEGTGKGKSLESVTTKESESKSGKKRRRR